jgi:hypothetical protein
MQRTEHPTPTCVTDGCDHAAEIRLWTLRPDGTRREPALLCVTDATRVYDVYDRNRRGGKVEIEAL